MLSVWRYLKCRYQSIEFSRRDTPWKTNQWQWKDNQCNEDMKMTISYWELGDVPWSSSDLLEMGQMEKIGISGRYIWTGTRGMTLFTKQIRDLSCRCNISRTKNSSINALKKRQGGIISVDVQNIYIRNIPKSSNVQNIYIRNHPSCQH